MNPAIVAVSRFGIVGAVLGLALFVGYKIIERNQPQQESAQTNPKRPSNPRRRAPPKPGNNCSICQDELRAPIEILPCSHIFHKVCLSHWFRMRTVCPVCREEVKEEDLDDRYKSLMEN